MNAWRLAAVGAALSVYALISYALMTWWPAQFGSAVWLFGPLLVAVTGSLVARAQWVSLIAVLVLASALGWAIGTARFSPDQLYVLQHGAIHLALAWGFGSTLRAGRLPLITRLAEQVHEQMSTEQRAYTRRLTGVWTAYFVAMLATSGLLYAAAPWGWWTLFCNLFTPASAVALFAGEHVMRYRWHPEFERVSMARAFRAYRSLGQPAPVHGAKADAR